MAFFEHFYYGQLIHHKKPSGEQRVLARSKKITDQQVKIITQLANLSTAPKLEDGAWGIIRANDTLPFILAHNQVGEFGQHTQHFVILTAEFLREIAGNIEVFLPVVTEKMPVYEMLGDDLRPLKIEAKTLSTYDQVDKLLNLMTYAKNKTRKIEPLLAGVIHQKTRLVIYNAPTDATTRTAFIQGILTLLPSSTRFALTFSTYATPFDELEVQLTFQETIANEEDTVIYDWETGDIRGDDAKDDYSRFIVSQLRMDPELSLQQAELLTPVAGWRFRKGATLGDALDYASYRSRLDKSLDNNMPIEAHEVAKVLAEDPTLDEKTALKYARHLITFSVALGNLDHIDPLIRVLRINDDFAHEVYLKLDTMLNDGDSDLIFDTLLRWYAAGDMPRGKEWQMLLQKASLLFLSLLIEDNDIEGINEFLGDLLQLRNLSNVSSFMANVVDRLLRISSESSQIATQTFLLAMTYLDQDKFDELLIRSKFTSTLPTPIKRFLSAINNPDAMPQEGTLVYAVNVLGMKHHSLAFSKFSEMAYKANAFKLFDTPTLKLLTSFATTEDGRDSAGMLIAIVRELETNIEILTPPGNQYLLQILLAVGRYDLLVQGLVDQSRSYYGGERQLEYIAMLLDLFSGTSIMPEQALRALDNIKERGMRGVPLLSASVGMLQGTQWSDQMREVALQQRDVILAHREELDVIPTNIIFTLLDYFIQQGDDRNVQTILQILPLSARHLPDKSALSIINRSYKHLHEHEKYRSLSFELLLQFTRVASDTAAQRMVQYFGKELGDEAKRRLHVAYTFSNFLGRLEFGTFAVSVGIAVEILRNNHETYMKGASKPSTGQMIGVITDLNPRLRTDDRALLASELKTLAQTLVNIGEQHKQQSTSTTRHIDAVVTGKQAPKSIVDILRCMSGSMSGGKVYPTRLSANPHPDPFSETALNDLVVNLGIIADMLEAMLSILKDGKMRVRWSAKDIANEVRSLRQMLDNEYASEIIKDLARHLQDLAQLITLIHQDIDINVLQPSSRTGRKLDDQSIAPDNTIEMYRFLYSYYD